MRNSRFAAGSSRPVLPIAHERPSTPVHLRTTRSARLQLALIVGLAGGAAFLCSAVMLWSSERMASMTLRYPAAAAAGYLAFLGLIRMWLALHRASRRREDGVDVTGDVVGEAASAVLEGSAPREVPGGATFFAGGRGGGAGAAQSFGVPRSSPGPVPTSAGGMTVDLDGDTVWLIVASLCAAGGLFAVAYVIYLAPVLLAEVALDAAVASAVYRSLRREESTSWLMAAVRRTWAPAVVVILFALAAGYGLERAAPEARSIGGVVRAFGQ